MSETEAPGAAISVTTTTDVSRTSGGLTTMRELDFIISVKQIFSKYFSVAT